MRDSGKHSVLGVLIDAVDYEAAIIKIIAAAHEKQGFAVSALAVHGVMTGALDPVQRHRLNHFDLVVPDGQPVRWALNWLHGTRLDDRVYGPTLMLRLCERAAAEQLPIYLYGSRDVVLAALEAKLRRRFPALQICGAQPSRFRQTTAEEKQAIARTIRESGAAITFVGLGCPRQETWAYEYREELGMPILAVGAAFDFHAGLLPQAPPALQRRGLEWLFRLWHEPRRLWRRYLLLNPAYLGLLLLQAAKLMPFHAQRTLPPQHEARFG